MKQAELIKILPHRDGMLLIDEAEVREGTAYGKKYIRPEEWFLQGHFPDDPIVPGVVLCEILAQSACVLLAEDTMAKHTFLTTLEKARFKDIVRPGDLLVTKCVMEKVKKPFFWAKGEGYVGDRLCVSASFSFMVTGDGDGVS